MAKKVDGLIKLQIPAGNATPAPPVGPALGQKGVNIMDFCKQFNAKTADQAGMLIPVVITVYEDKSFEFVIKTPPAAIQLMEAAKIKGGSGEPNRNKDGAVSWDQVKKIAEDNLGDLNCFTLDSALTMVAGTARSMGVRVTGTKPTNA